MKVVTPLSYTIMSTSKYANLYTALNGENLPSKMMNRGKNTFFDLFHSLSS